MTPWYAATTLSIWPTWFALEAWAAATAAPAAPAAAGPPLWSGCLWVWPRMRWAAVAGTDGSLAPTAAAAECSNGTDRRARSINCSAKACRGLLTEVGKPLLVVELFRDLKEGRGNAAGK